MVIEFLAGHKILQGGYLTVQLPPELYFVEDSSCDSFSAGFDSASRCVFDRDTNLMTVRDAFNTVAYDTLETLIQIEVAGIFTPRSVKPTTNFEIKTFDSEDWLIDTHSTYFLPAQVAAKDVEVMRVIQGDNVVGARTTYDLLL